MNRTMLMTTTALATFGLALAAVPTGAAITCRNGTAPYVAQTCSYVFSGEAGRDARATAGFVEDQAIVTPQFIWDTCGDDLP